MDGKEFHFRLSAILRTYIQGRYGINAPEMTTEEFVPRIADLGIPRELRKCLKSLCRTSDPVKFAGVHAVESEMRKDLMFVRNFVRQTTPETIPHVGTNKPDF